MSCRMKRVKQSPMPDRIGGMDVPVICPTYDSVAKVMIAYPKDDHFGYERQGELIPLPQEG